MVGLRDLVEPGGEGEQTDASKHEPPRHARVAAAVPMIRQHQLWLKL